MQTPHITIRVSKEEKAQLTAIAAREGTNVSALLLSLAADKYPEFQPSPRKEGKPYPPAPEGWFYDGVNGWVQK